MAGIIADSMIAMGLGVSCVYWLTLMGKDKHILKGAGLGAMEWGSLYGVLSRLGATIIFPVKSIDALTTFLSHLAFGATKIVIAEKLGDPRLFKPGNLTLEVDQPLDLVVREENSSPYYYPWMNSRQMHQKGNIKTRYNQ